jgi:hypothetical protein
VATASRRAKQPVADTQLKPLDLLKVAHQGTPRIRA